MWPRTEGSLALMESPSSPSRQRGLVVYVFFLVNVQTG